VFALPIRSCANHHDAEDAAQEVFLRLCRQGETARKIQIRDPRAWLAQVTWRLAVEKSRRHSSVELNQGALDLALQHLRDSAPGSEEQAVSAEALQTVQSLIEGLPEKDGRP